MAIAPDASTKALQAFDTSLTFSHTVGAGSNTLLIVAVMILTGGGGQTVSGVTYNGTAMSKLDGSSSAMVADSGGSVRTELWTLKAPSSGAHNVVISLAGGGASFFAVASSWTGVDQTTPLGTAAKTTVASGDISVSPSSATGDVVVDAVTENGVTIPTPGAGQTVLQQDNSFKIGASSYKAGAASSTTMSWSSSDEKGQVAVALKPAAAGTTFTQSVAGASGSLSGAVTRITLKPLTGASGALSGTLAKAAQKVLSGATGAVSGVVAASKFVAVVLSGAVGALAGSVGLARVIPVLGWRLRKSGERGWKYPRDGK